MTSARSLSWLLTVLLGTLSAGETQPGAQQWPQWRGPTGMGHSPAKDLPTTWGGAEKTNVRWSAPLPDGDPTQSSPIVWGERVIVTTARNKPPEHRVTCWRTTDGERLWSTEIAPGPWVLNDFRGGYACATPATDGERIYALFGSAVLVALDFDGKVVWRRDITPHAFDVAIASSPIVYNGTVILLCDQTGGKSFIAGYDAKTGENRWTQQRPTAGFNHSTPLLVNVAGKPLLLVSASNAFQGLDPKDGSVRWSCPSKGDVTTPVVSGTVAYTDEGRGGPGILVDITGQGEVGATHLKWTIKQGTNGMDSPIIVDGRLYRTSVALRCYDLASGKELWSERLGGDFPPSPIATADGLIYYASGGKSWVLRAGPTFDLVDKSDLGDPGNASPAIAGGRLFLKGGKTLFCIGKP